MSSTTRIVGIDVARGLAVLGMLGAHVGVIPQFDWLQPESWTGIVSGRSSILFAMLAGVSIAIISGSADVVRGADLSRVRIRLATRALLVFLIGVLLVALGTNVAVILPVYGVLFLLALPLLRMPPPALFATVLGVAVVVPPVLGWIGPTLDDPPNAAVALASNLFLTGSYPALLWIAFLLTGLAIGRFDLTAWAVQWGLLGVGAALAVLGYATGELAAATVGPSSIVTTAPHSGSPFEVIGSTGFAIAILGLCLLASRVIHAPLFPLAAVGSMALSVYSLQILTIAISGVSVPGDDDNRPWIIFAAVALAAASLWKVLIGRGPLEWLLTAASRGAEQLIPAVRLETATPQRRNQES